MPSRSRIGRWPHDLPHRDLHHATLRTGNQAHCDISEIQVAQRYTRMLEEAGVKVTFFVSGRSFTEEWSDLEPICASPVVELGGHNWDCFSHSLLHRASKKLLGSYNGPAWLQKRDAQRTIDVIRERTGRTIRAWRNHMYMHGPHTEKVLAGCGIQVCSDGVRRASQGLQFHPAGIYNLPLNIMPDHEHLYHAERTPEWVEWWIRRYGWSDDFGSASYPVEEWTDRVLEQLEHNENRGVPSTMIIHPITLYLCDGLRSFGRILDFLRRHRTAWVSELHQAAVRASLGKELAS